MTTSQTTPGVVILTLGNQPGVTIVDMANPAREGAPGAPVVAPLKRKYRRRHLDKSRLDEANDKEFEHGEE